MGILKFGYHFVKRLKGWESMLRLRNDRDTPWLWMVGDRYKDRQLFRRRLYIISIGLDKSANDGLQREYYTSHQSGRVSQYKQ